MVSVQRYPDGRGREYYNSLGEYFTQGGEYPSSRVEGELLSTPAYVETLEGHYAKVAGDAGSLGGLYLPVEEYGGRYASLQGHFPSEEDYGGGYDSESAQALDYEDDDYVFLWPWVDPLTRLQSTVDRQSFSPADPLFMAAVVGIGLVLLVPLLIIAGAQLSPMMAPKLQNHEMCGITTGGQEECYWDCPIVSSPQTAGQVIGRNLSCLLDCFPESTQRQGSDSSCIASLLRDVIEKKTCDRLDANGASAISNPGTWGTNTSCIIELPNCVIPPDLFLNYTTGCPADCFLTPTITEGTCTEDTETFLATEECKQAIFELPGLLQNTVRQLIRFSCVPDKRKTGRQEPEDCQDYLDSTYPDYDYDYDYDYEKRYISEDAQTSRLAPVALVTPDFKTELDYTHTRHRYPWICSLRTRGVNPEHLCAVTLLSVPPQPTVVVGAAHCTYLCKDTDSSGRRLPTCCCVTIGQETCSDNTAKCGSEPRVVEMEGSDAEILCGEWQTGTTLQASGEEYNVVLPITEIVRHPDFDAKDEGPAGGSDIAVFKVTDTDLSEAGENKIYPACLPADERAQPLSGVHSGWSKPPPLLFLHKFAEGYVKHYADFFKQWHYNMDIQQTCKDPTKSQTFVTDLEYPSDTFYPAGTICARAFDRQSCFSTGDSGSPLMAREEERPDRLYAEGILSFVRGCDTFTIGSRNNNRTVFQLNQLSENPATYTKLSCFLPWVARQYGLSYDGDPATDETCSRGSGGTSPPQPCRETISNLIATEYECIFPFYYKGVLYNECALLEQEGFVYPTFRCPVRNITTKRDGINDFGDPIDLAAGFCFISPTNEEATEGQLDTLNPDNKNCSSSARIPPFSTCKNDCPGVRSFGIIGGGGVLLVAPIVGGFGFITSSLGLGAMATTALGLTGIMTASSMCLVPFCRAQSGQCCLLGGSNRGAVCPSAC